MKRNLWKILKSTILLKNLRMTKYFSLAVLLFVMFSCHTSQKSNEIRCEVHQDSEHPNKGVLKGKVLFGDTDEPAVNVKVWIVETKLGALTDLDGNFEIRGINPGTYSVEVSSIGYATKRLDNLVIKPNEITFIDEFIIPDKPQVELLKPIIYFYPEDTTDVLVNLDFDGDLEYTYPTYNNGWEVTASPDGTLRDATGRTYYGLFWEGPSRQPLEANTGFVVNSDTIVPFLEDKLYQLGLNDREANEFIIFWYPILSKSSFNLIHFATSEYTSQAVLNISPEPQTLIRVMMVYENLEDFKSVPSQVLPDRPKREGFKVVEWGGTEAVQPEF